LLVVEHVKSVREATVREGKQPKAHKPFMERNATVNLNTYTSFFFSTKANYALVPITLFLFLVSEGITTVYFRFLAMYMQVKTG
jgi:hypothetical protein